MLDVQLLVNFSGCNWATYCQTISIENRVLGMKHTFFQDAVVDTLLIKVRRALRDTHEHAIVVAGGVSANQYLRESLAVLADKHNWQVFFPRQEFCTDNGAMIAYVGAMRLAKGEADPADLSVVARWPLAEL